MLIIIIVNWNWLCTSDTKRCIQLVAGERAIKLNRNNVLGNIGAARSYQLWEYSRNGNWIEFHRGGLACAIGVILRKFKDFDQNTLMMPLPREGKQESLIIITEKWNFVNWGKSSSLCEVSITSGENFTLKYFPRLRRCLPRWSTGRIPIGITF